MRAVETLSTKLQVPLHEVREVYANELQRLAAYARIRNFLGVLAASSTRLILCSRNQHAHRRRQLVGSGYRMS